MPDLVSSVSGFIVRPGDTLIVGVEGRLAAEQADLFKAHLMSRMPGLADVVVVVDATVVGVYRPEVPANA